MASLNLACLHVTLSDRQLVTLHELQGVSPGSTILRFTRLLKSLFPSDFDGHISEGGFFVLFYGFIPLSIVQQL